MGNLQRLWERIGAGAVAPVHSLRRAAKRQLDKTPRKNFAPAVMPHAD